MTLEPLLSAPAAIQFHVATIVPAALLGAYLLARPKGTPVHRLLGKVWLVLMVVSSASTFFIHAIDVLMGFSPIHLLSVYVIVGSHESDIASGRLSVTSPLARALIGKTIGDIVEVTTPRGHKSYEIVRVSYS